MFKFNGKDTRTTLTSFWWVFFVVVKLEHKSQLSIYDFEQVFVFCDYE